MVATESELQIPTPQLQDLGDDRNLVSLLRRRVAAREPFAADSSIQEADVYSAAPAELVRYHAPGMDPSEGKEMAWYFFSPANYHETPGARRRKRKVGGADAGETCCWHPEAGKVPILGPDKKPVGAYKRKLSYVLKIKNPPGSAKPYRNKSLGWIMVEIGLEQGQADQQLVLCKVYKSPRPRWDAEISIEACSIDGDEKPCLAPLPPAAALSSCDSQGTIKEQPPPSTHHAFKHGIRSRPMEENRRGVAIVKKAAAAAVTVVMKFGGSLMQSGDGMKEMAKLIRSFPDGGGESPVVVLSAMGNTTNNLLLAAGKALSLRPQEASEIHELVITKELHFRMVDDLGLQRSIASGSLDELENIFMAIAVMKELTSKTRDYLVSFGEHMSTRIFSAYLNKLGEGAQQEWKLFALDTYGRGGSDLTTTTIGRVFGSREIQVWKDVDGVLTCDPNVCANAIPLPYLTFDEAVELGLFDGQSMQLAMEGGIPVIVKNLYNPEAPGTMITKTRDMSKSVLTSIVLRSNITVLSIESTRMLDHSVFLARSFSTFADLGMPVDCVAISEGKISLIVVPSKLWSHELFQLELDNVVEELRKFAVVYWLQDRSVISLTGGTQTSPTILLKAFNVLHSINVEVQKFSQGSSKVMKVSLVVNDTEAKQCVQALHSVFFEMGFVSEVQGTERELNASPEQMPVNSPAAPASFGDKIKVDDDHLEASLSVCKQQRTDTDGRSSVVEETERTAFSDKAGNPPELFEDDGGVPEVPEVQPKEEEQQHVLPVPVRESSSAPEAVQPEQQERVEVGESSSGPPAPGALEDETEGSHHPMTDDNALEDIRRRILADDDYHQQWGDSGVDHPWDDTEPQFFNNNSTTIGGDADGAFNYFVNNIN